jgi:hypothetical protein
MKEFLWWLVLYDSNSTNNRKRLEPHDLFHQLKAKERASQLKKRKVAKSDNDLIDEHTTVFSWVIILQGRSFNASVDITKAFPVNGRSTRDWEVSIKFIIISELHGR